MRIRIIGMALVLALFGTPACKNKEPKTTCIYGNNIPDADLNPILDLSDRLMDLLTKGQLKDIYEAGTDEMKTGQNRDQFVQGIELFTRMFGKIEFPRAEEVYFMDSDSKQSPVWISCNLGEPGVNDLYHMPANKKLAVVIYRAHTEMEEMRVILQMEKPGDAWRLRSLGLNPMTLKHNTAEYYQKQAQEARERNQLHLAVLDYKTAILISDLGMNVAEATVKVLDDQMTQIKVDYMPAGEVQIWATDSGHNYKVYNLDPAYDNGNLLVQISYLTPTISDKTVLEKEARDLALFLDQKFPEYRQGFDGIRITAAPEKKEELMMSYHIVILFKDLPAQPPANQIPAPETRPVTPAPSPPASEASPSPEKPPEANE
jgi:hypothetical protein